MGPQSDRSRRVNGGVGPGRVLGNALTASEGSPRLRSMHAAGRGSGLHYVVSPQVTDSAESELSGPVPVAEF
jgi:hypothetical protein